MSTKFKNMPKNKNKKFFIKKRSKPLVLTFDNEAREDFLTGFRKRKLQRKKKAQEELEVELKAERKRIKLEAKNALQKMVVSHRDIPELAKYRDEEADVVDMDTHQVLIKELDSAQLARENNWIGINQVKYHNPEEEKHSEEEEESTSEIEGMELAERRKKSVSADSTKGKTASTDFKSKKEVKKYIQQISAKNVKKSTAFKKKKDLEKTKNKKRKLREERQNTKKTRSKREKHKKRRP